MIFNMMRDGTEFFTSRAFKIKFYGSLFFQSLLLGIVGKRSLTQDFLNIKIMTE